MKTTFGNTNRLTVEMWAEATLKDSLKDTMFYSLLAKNSSCPDFNSKSIKEWWRYHNPTIKDYRKGAKDGLTDWFAQELDDKMFKSITKEVDKHSVKDKDKQTIIYGEKTV